MRVADAAADRRRLIRVVSLQRVCDGGQRVGVRCPPALETDARYLTTSQHRHCAVPPRALRNVISGHEVSLRPYRSWRFRLRLTQSANPQHAESNCLFSRELFQYELS